MDHKQRKLRQILVPAGPHTCAHSDVIATHQGPNMVSVCICVCVVCICVYVYMYMCVQYVYTSVCMCVCVYVSLSVSLLATYAHLHVVYMCILCMRVCTHTLSCQFCSPAHAPITIPLLVPTNLLT